MHRLLSVVLFSLLAAVPLRAETVEDEVRVADTARVLSTLRGDADRLARLLSDELVYNHADGRAQTKEVFLAAVRTNKIKYDAYDYLEKKITRVSGDVAVMSGRAHLKASSPKEHVEFDIRFLAVWRRESGDWRLFAYQSTRMSDPVVIAK